MKRAAISCVLVTGLLALGCLLYLDRAPTPPKAFPPYVVAKPEPTMEALATKPTTITRPSRRTVPPSATFRALEAEYHNATNKREFYEKARKQPLDGGVYFAYRTVMDCTVIAGKGTYEKNLAALQKFVSDHKVDPKIPTAAFKRVYDPCKSLSDKPATEFGIEMKEGTNAGDPVMLVKKEMFEDLYKDPDPTQRLTSILLRAADHPNPYVLMEVATSLGASSYARLLVDGAPLPGDEARFFFIASQLLPCQFGIDCSENGFASQLACAGGLCGLSNLELFQRGVSPAEAERIFYWFKRLDKAFTSRDFSMFSMGPKR